MSRLGRQSAGIPACPAPPVRSRSGAPRPQAPAVYCGWQKGTALIPGFEVWTLLRDIEGHPAGSSVSRQTLELAGYWYPPVTRSPA